jgi:SAM-dependent methyltransferase
VIFVRLLKIHTIFLKKTSAGHKAEVFCFSKLFFQGEEVKNTPWYSEEAKFFGANYLASYNHNLTEERTTKEVLFLEEKLGLGQGASILDCPCGHGRHSIELAKRGYSIVGQDLNGFFLKKAEEDAAKAGVKVRFRKGDMRDLPFEAEFDVALNLFTAFGYFETEEEDQEFLTAVVKTLKPNGKFLIDFVNRDRVVREEWRPKWWQENKNGLLVLDEREFDILASKEHRRQIIIFPDGTRKDSDIHLRLYTLRELLLMCRKVGLKPLEVFGDFDGSPISLYSKRVILITQKS